ARSNTPESNTPERASNVLATVKGRANRKGRLLCILLAAQLSFRSVILSKSYDFKLVSGKLLFATLGGGACLSPNP
ncbi:MAG: hypothetical protein EBY21_08590, partial [Alphaproteobacteria bacterium]|nr:hypothetical protein [Alphaproteobacteria bacterium]